MDFTLTAAEKKIQEVAREFAENEVEPIASEIDLTGEYPEENFQKMAKIGFNGIGVPVEYGGSGGDELTKALVVQEIAKKCAATAAILSIHGIFGQGVLQFGTEEQKKEYLPQVTEGGKHAAFALTEPNAGSDAAAVATTAIKDGDDYVLNGTKCFISGGSVADYVIIFALTTPGIGTKGISAIIVPTATKGFSVGKVEDKMGIRASETAELIMDNCRVPQANLLGREGKGFNIAMALLDSARLGVAAQAVGICDGAIDEARQYMHERVQFNQEIAQFQGLRWYMADMATRTEAARSLLYAAVNKKISGERFTTEAAMAKLFAAETAQFVTDRALQIHGGYGYMKDYPLERMARDAKITEIYEGTSEIHKVVISRAVLGR